MSSTDYPTENYLSELRLRQRRLVMVGGKGGVGKTTCAAAIASHMAEAGLRTLILSSDPTPSLSDIFEVSVGPRETRIEGISNLSALEISSDVVLQCWRERFAPEIYHVVSSFADLDYDFVTEYVGGAPGIEEEYMLYYITELVDAGRYDLVVWDTAPAGHTLRLLHLPELFLKHLEGATKFYLNLYSYLEKAKDAVNLRKGKRSLLHIIEGWQQLSEKIADFITDQQSAEYVLVTIPEALGVRQTERIVEDFAHHQLPVHYLIVNHVIAEADCTFHRIRRDMQEEYIRFLAEKYRDRLVLIFLPLAPHEIRGLERIRVVSTRLFGPRPPIG